MLLKDVFFQKSPPTNSLPLHSLKLNGVDRRRTSGFRPGFGDVIGCVLAIHTE